jgi:hypothetical protein
MKTEGTQSVREQILSRVGKKVSFKYPENEGDKHGILKDRAVVESTTQKFHIGMWST